MNQEQIITNAKLLSSASLKNPVFKSNTSRDIYMAVDFIAAKVPSWKAIKTKLQPKPKLNFPLQINLESLTERNLGPGTYTVSSQRPGPNYGFSSVPRFSNSDKIKLILPNLKKTTEEVIKKGKEISYKNLDISPHTISNRVIRMRSVSQHRNVSALNVRKNKEMISTQDRQSKLEKIRVRNVKYERWFMMRSFIQAKKGWIVLHVCLAAAQNLNKIKNFKRKLSHIFSKNAKILYQVSRCVGNICMKLKKMRRNKSFTILQSMLLPLLKQRMDRLVVEFRNNITMTLSRCLTTRLFKRLIPAWKKRVQKAESGLRMMLEVHDSRLDMLVSFWDLIQTSYHMYSDKIIIPAQDSLRILRKYLFKKLRDYYTHKQEFIENLNRLKREMRKYVENKRVFTRKPGMRFSLNTTIFPIFRIYHKEEIIRLYLEEEAIRRNIDDRKESMIAVPELVIREVIKKRSATRLARSPREST